MLRELAIEIVTPKRGRRGGAPGVEALFDAEKDTGGDRR